MGRMLKRVPLDFSWPLERIWEGYKNPHYKRCSVCNGKGTTGDRERLRNIVGTLLSSAEAARKGKDVWYFQQAGSILSDGATLSPALYDLVAGLTRRPERKNDRPFGFDSIDSWAVVNTIVEAAGLPEEWGYCPACDGEGDDPSMREAYEAWKPTDPPTGPGYQLWEDVSEGSPISPVFPTEESFVMYLLTQGYSEKAARNFVRDGWAVSGIITEQGMVTGVETARFHKDPEEP